MCAGVLAARKIEYKLVKGKIVIMYQFYVLLYEIFRYFLPSERKFLLFWETRDGDLGLK